MKLPLSFWVFAIAGFIAPAAEAGQQSGDVRWGQKARPDPVPHRPDPVPHSVDILASNNLTATGPVLADAGAVTVPAAQTVKYDAAYSVCKAVVPTSHEDFSLANFVGPGASVAYYFISRGIPLEAIGPSTVVVTGQPQHGELRQDSDGAYVYYPNEGYLGPDQMTFVVEAQGKKFKVIETVWVANVAPEYGGCPADYKLPPATTGNDKGSALDIIELPADGPIDSEALAKLQAKLGVRSCLLPFPFTTAVHLVCTIPE